MQAETVRVVLYRLSSPFYYWGRKDRYNISLDLFSIYLISIMRWAENVAHMELYSAEH